MHGEKNEEIVSSCGCWTWTVFKRRAFVLGVRGGLSAINWDPKTPIEKVLKNVIDKKF